MKKNSIRMFVLVMVAIVCVGGLGTSSMADIFPKKIAIFPFEVISQEDQSFIGKGMGKMLCTRVGQGEGVQVTCLDKPFDTYQLSMDDGLMDAIARSESLQGMGFLLMGSITIAGNAVSTDARLVDVTGKRKPVNIHESGTGLGDVMRHAVGVAEKVRRVLAGKALPVAGMSSAIIKPEETAVLSVGTVPLEGTATSLGSTSGIADTQGRGAATTVPLFVSRSLPGEITGLTILDMDGEKQIAVIDARRLTVFSWQNQKLVKKAELKGKYYQTFMGLDAMDCDADGRDELFLTILDRKNQLRSLVVKEVGESLTLVAKDLPWFFRVIKIDGQKQLLGQRTGQDQLFWGDIHQLSFDGRDIIPGAVKMNGNGGVFGRSLGHPAARDSLRMVWFDKDGYLNLGKENFEKEWVSDGSWGSTALFVTYDQGKNSVDQRVYFNSRVAIEDVDGNGNDEVIAVVNHDQSRGFLPRFRKFTRGYVSFLEWSGNALVERWKTQHVSGYVADFSLGDMNGDGLLELVYASVVASEGLVGKNKSHIVVQSIGSLEK
ncbi:MAG: hypothetical protein QM498_13775 [Desulfobacterium sp.]